MRPFIQIFFIVLLTASLLTPHSMVEPEVSWISGTISKDTTWSGEVYVTGVEVAQGVTLTIEPGTVVRFQHWRHGYSEFEGHPADRSALIVKGTLLAFGTTESQIKFTSDAPSPEHGDWEGIIFMKPGSDQSILDHCIIEYAKNGIMANDVNFTLSNSIARWSTGCNVGFLRSSPTIIHNRLYESGHGVIEMEGYCHPTIKYNTIWGGRNGIFVSIESHATIQHNIIRDLRAQGSGIQITSNSSATIEYNTITGDYTGITIFAACSASEIIIERNNIYNNTCNIHLQTVEDLIAENNWWGTTDEKQIESKINWHEGRVLYKPYLTFEVDIGEITYDYENYEAYFHLPQSENDTYLYLYPDDLTRKVIDTWHSGGGFPSGITWDNKHLWVCTAEAGYIRKFDTLGNLIDEFRSPGPWPYGLTFDGEYLWCLDYSEVKVYQLDSSGKVIKSISAPGKNPRGLAYDGKYLWSFLFGGEIGIAYKFDTLGNVIDSIQTPGWNGLAWDGDHLWVSSGMKIYEMDTSNGNVINVITSSGDETCGLTWQNSYLWCGEWASEIEEDTRIVKLLPEKEKITIDGLKDDWQGFSPLILDPKEIANEETDIKAIHGFTDDKYFYLMIEPYAKTLDSFDHVNIKMDINRDGIPEFLLDSARCRGTPAERQWGIGVGITDMRGDETKYSYFKWAPGYLYAHSNMKDVFEFKIPLSFIENYNDFNIKCSFMDESEGEWFMIDEADWTHISARLYSAISCSVSPSAVTMGDSITVSGAISPALPGKTVILTYNRPNGSTFNRTATTGSDGSYSDSFKPDVAGLWSVIASWDGDSTHHGASTLSITFTVRERPFIETPLGLITLFGGIVAITIATVFIVMRKRKSARCARRN